LQLVAVELSQALSDFGARDRLLLAHEGMLERPSQGRQFTHGFRRLDQLVDRRLELGIELRHDLAQHRQRLFGPLQTRAQQVSVLVEQIALLVGVFFQQREPPQAIAQRRHVSACNARARMNASASTSSRTRKSRVPRVGGAGFVRERPEQGARHAPEQLDLARVIAFERNALFEPIDERAMAAALFNNWYSLRVTAGVGREREERAIDARIGVG